MNVKKDGKMSREKACFCKVPFEIVVRNFNQFIVNSSITESICLK